VKYKEYYHSNWMAEDIERKEGLSLLRLVRVGPRTECKAVEQHRNVNKLNYLCHKSPKVHRRSWTTNQRSFA